jgi:CRISPR type I-E-associated protein CasA/Cse1
MWWYPGLRLKSSVRDPFKCYLHPKDKNAEPYPRAFQSDRALWRDSETFLDLRNERAEIPKIIEGLKSLDSDVLPMNNTLRLLALGIAKDKAKVEFLRAERLPLPPAYLKSDELVERLTRAIGLGERTANALRDGLRSMAGRYLKPAKQESEYTKEDREAFAKLADGWRATDRYWSRLDVHIAELMNELAAATTQRREEAANRWRTQIERAARDAFEYAEDCLGDESRAARARALGRDAFERRLRWELSPQADAAISKENATDE